MGKFKYSMQNILDIKIKLETQAKNEFSEANRAYLIEKEKLEELFKKRAVYEAALKEQLSGSLNIQVQRPLYRSRHQMLLLVRPQAAAQMLM